MACRPPSWRRRWPGSAEHWPMGLFRPSPCTATPWPRWPRPKTPSSRGPSAKSWSCPEERGRDGGPPERRTFRVGGGVRGAVPHLLGHHGRERGPGRRPVPAPRGGRAVAMGRQRLCPHLRRPHDDRGHDLRPLRAQAGDAVGPGGVRRRLAPRGAGPQPGRADRGPGGHGRGCRRLRAGHAVGHPPPVPRRGGARPGPGRLGGGVGPGSGSRPRDRGRPGGRWHLEGGVLVQRGRGGRHLGPGAGGCPRERRPGGGPSRPGRLRHGCDRPERHHLRHDLRGDQRVRQPHGGRLVRRRHLAAGGLRAGGAQSCRPHAGAGYFGSAPFSGALVVVFVLFFGVFSIFFFTALYLAAVAGYSASRWGLRFLPTTLSLIVASGLSGRRVAVAGPRSSLAEGCVMAGAGVLLSEVLLSRPGAPSSWLYLTLALAGFGFGTSVVPVTAVVLSVVPPQRSGMAAAATNTSREL